MSHKSGHIIIRRVTNPTETTDPVREISVEMDITGMTPEEAGKAVRKMSRKLDSIEHDEPDEG